MPQPVTNWLGSRDLPLGPSSSNSVKAFLKYASKNSQAEQWIPLRCFCRGEDSILAGKQVTRSAPSGGPRKQRGTEVPWERSDEGLCHNTGAIFGLLTLAHVWRVIEEGRQLATEPFYVLVTVAAAALCVWALRLLWQWRGNDK